LIKIFSHYPQQQNVIARISRKPSRNNSSQASEL
jgi:hypothetical protein